MVAGGALARMGSLLPRSRVTGQEHPTVDDRRLLAERTVYGQDSFFVCHLLPPRVGDGYSIADLFHKMKLYCLFEGGRG